MKFVVIADGGGSKTAAQLVETASGTTYEVMEGACVPSTDIGAAVSCIDRLVERFGALLGHVIDPSESAIALATAGIDATEIRVELEAALSGRFATVRLVSDAEASLLGCVGEKDGAVVGIGTGVMARSHRAGFGARTFGGWGWPAGDRGGGAWLGRRAIEEFLDAADGSLPASDRLLQDFTNRIGPSRESIFRWLAIADRGSYASLAGRVVAAADSGSALGLRLLAEAGARVGPLVANLNAAGHDIIHLTGGLAEAIYPHIAVGVPLRLVKNASFAGAKYLAAPWLDRTPMASDAGKARYAR